jgi:transposase
MRVTTLLNRLLHLPGLWVQGLEIEDDVLLIHVRRRFRLLTCPECGKRVRGRFEEKTRQWRHLGVWGRKTLIQGPIRRLRCPRCRTVRTERVPWARPGSDFTLPFEDAVGLLAQKLDQTAVARLMGISWVTVGSIAARLVAEHLDANRLDGLRRIGIDEIHYGHHGRCLSVVVDHDRERVVWAGPGKNQEALDPFFDELGPERARSIELVSLDMAKGYEWAVAKRIPHAQIVYDRYHVVRLAQNAVNDVRKSVLRQTPEVDKRHLKRSRWVLLRRSDKLERAHLLKLVHIKRVNEPVYRAYLLKESFLRLYDETDPREAREGLLAWLGWASRSRLRPFVRLARTARDHMEGILRFVSTGLTNARCEGMNNKIRLLSHRAFGFHSASSLIAAIYLCCSKMQLPELQLI